MNARSSQHSLDEEHRHELCPAKKVCGSCKWSHIPYEKQLAQKLSDINGSFRLHGVTYDCEEILPSPQTSHYRNRMDFAIDFQGRMGLREKGKWWRVLDGHHCFISDEKIEELFERIRAWLPVAELSFFDRKAHVGLLRYAVIRTTLLNESLVTIITSAPENEEEHTQVEKALHLLAESLPGTHLVWSIAHTVSDVSRGEEIVPIHGAPQIREQIADFVYAIHPFTFFQTNSRGAEILLETVQSYARGIQGDRFVDLYCGSGFFTLPLATQFQKTYGVEIEEEAIARARENQQLNAALLQGREISFVTSKSEESAWTAEEPDLLLVDPPRAGLHDTVIEQIKQVRPRNLISVSCNYKALARELQHLEGAYEVRKMKAIDMFPHTPHVEVVTLLEAK
ncbi:23S rRNA (uracil(1939)-C(5))-methyltransferase RlmD [bacterium]|nr:23S rRNA (uracil(1939)-C(5))-methyltransferase RlmD [bacterium]